MENSKSYKHRIKQKIRITNNYHYITDNTMRFASDISRLIKRKSVVPVICEDMFEYENPSTKEHQPFHTYILEKLLEKYDGQLQLTEKEFDNVLSDCYYAISLLKAKIGKDLYYDIFTSVVDEEDNLYEGVCLKKDIAVFLKVCQFPLIITTNCFSIIEKELGPEYKSYWSKLGKTNDQPLPEKCIYHILGEAEAESSNWGYCDKQVLRFLSSYYSDYPLKNLTSLIENNYSHKALLFLGNNAPDWLFRFILNPIYGGDVYDDSKGFYFSDRIEESLSQFLHDIKFEKEEQMLDTIRMVTEKQKKEYIRSDISLHERYDFFVAHASEDTAKARKLVEYLKSRGKKVWFDDNETRKGGEYWKRIIDGLTNSTYFMPLITENYIAKLCDTKSRDEAFSKCNIDEICFDSEKLALLDDELSGVVVELALAEKNFINNKINEQNIYSLPVITSETYYYAIPVTQGYLELLSKDSNYLPQKLFYGIQMYYFDTNSYEIKDFNICNFK